MKAAAGDVTVLRSDLSLSGRPGGGGATAPRVLKQRFVLDEKLGSGGMGTVFRAKDLRKVEARDRNPYVAVKVLNNDFREHPEAFIALQREAAKSQGLSHRNIVTIYDFDKDGDVPFIIMELLEGQELAEKLRAFPTGLPEDMFWPIVRCMCDGLEHAHESGLVHADFKPGNVFVAPNHSAKILDFGIARAVQINQATGGFGDDSVFDPTRLAALTPAYASPQMLDGAEAEVRDDLFSLGVVIYLMLTGLHPFGRVPANEAARNRLRVERPRGLSRRQWRVLERCLAFDRDRRPASVAELKEHLFQPSPWRSRTAVVAVLAVLVTFAVSGIKEEAAVEEAKVEVRQSTLVDAQLARLETLLAQAEIDAAWEATVADEVAGLLNLRQAGDPEPPIVARVRQRYFESVVASDDPGEAMALLQRGRQYGPMPRAEAYLLRRFAADVSALLDKPTLDGAWLDALDMALSRLAALFPGRMELEALRLETVAVLQAELERSLAGDRFPSARRALAYLEAYSFTPELVDVLRARVDRAEQRFLARQDRQALEAEREQFRAQLDGALAGACLRFDPAPAAAVLQRWVSRRPAFDAEGRRLVGEHVLRCVAQLQALDRERALDLKTRAQAAFGRLPGLDGLREDSCAAEYLVGSGSQGGRRGSCADRLGDLGQGPRLVVVPTPDQPGSFAITRQEVSWGELAAFCRATGRCEANPAADQPVSGIPVSVAEDYAVWLSERSGFHYRLPTYREWLQAARGTSDPNRNCLVQLGSVHRGLAPVAVSTGAPNPYGLVNVLGNVQEWVLDAGELKAAGGAFRDPIAECAITTVRSHRGSADPATGFRLVREVS
ncbi:MAG: bifunctional serine/threonine-protein kinase/formylglycine-generating enzyme family protein [Pseudomonadales bacterium]